MLTTFSVPLATKYHHEPLEAAVKRIVRKHCPVHKDCDGLDWNPWSMELNGERKEDDDFEPVSYEEPFSPESTKRICQS
jgi:hypothetical protein